MAKEKLNQLNREIKSVSAFAKRRTDSVLERYLGLDQHGNDLAKTKCDLASIYNKVTLCDYSGDETDEVQDILGFKKKEVLNKEIEIKKIQSNLKRPNTTLAISYTGAPSSSRLSQFNSNEVKYQLNENKHYSTEKKNCSQLIKFSNPICDERFKDLIKSMSIYKPNKDNESSNKPDLLVRHLINSNKALQSKNEKRNACEKNEKRNALIELNLKLFEKIVSNI